MGKKINAYRLTVGKPEGKSQLGRTRRRWWIILKRVIERQDWVVWT
jgi:hypothetical protein